MRVSERSRARLRDPVVANGLSLAASAGVSALLGSAFWFVAARRFDAAALGVGAAVVSASTLAALVGKAGFDAVVIRFGPSSDPRALRRLFARSVASALAVTTLAALVALALATRGIDALAPMREPLPAFAFVLLALATSAAWMLDALFISEQRGALVLARNVALNVGKLLVPFLVVAEWGARAVPLAWGAGLVLSLSLGAVVLPRLLGRHRAIGSRPPEAPWSYSMRNLTLNLSEFAPGLIMPILVLQALGPEENARFYLAWTIAAVGLAASKAVSQSAFAELVRARDPRPALRKALVLASILILPPVLLVEALGPWALRLFGTEYVQAAGALTLFTLALPLVALTHVYVAFLKARTGGWELTLLPVATLAVLVPLVPFALAWRGIEGLALAWLAVQTGAGAYAAARILLTLRKGHHVAPRTRVGRHPHQG